MPDIRFASARHIQPPTIPVIYRLSVGAADEFHNHSISSRSCLWEGNRVIVILFPLSIRARPIHTHRSCPECWKQAKCPISFKFSSSGMLTHTARVSRQLLPIVELELFRMSLLCSVLHLVLLLYSPIRSISQFIAFSLYCVFLIYTSLSHIHTHARYNVAGINLRHHASVRVDSARKSCPAVFPSFILRNRTLFNCPARI